MELIYRTVVIGIGKRAMEFIDEGMFVIFKDDAPEELKEFCIIHKENNLLKDIKENDLLKIGEDKFRIIGVGSVVNENLKRLGHITFRFDGEKETLGGSINLGKKDIPKITINKIIEIWR